MDAIEEQCGRDPAGIIARYKHAMEWANVLDEIPLQVKYYDARMGARITWAYRNSDDFWEIGHRVFANDWSILDPMLLISMTKDAHKHDEDPMILVNDGHGCRFMSARKGNRHRHYSIECRLMT